MEHAASFVFTEYAYTRKVANEVARVSHDCTEIVVDATLGHCLFAEQDLKITVKVIVLGCCPLKTPTHARPIFEEISTRNAARDRHMHQRHYERKTHAHEVR